MGKTWHPDRWDVALSFKRGERDDWRKEYEKELEEVDDVTEVYVIVDEWLAEDSEDPSSEIYGGKFFLTDSQAWSKLESIAEKYGVELSEDQTSFSVDENRLYGLEYDTYYIQRLTKE